MSLGPWVAPPLKAARLRWAWQWLAPRYQWQLCPPPYLPHPHPVIMYYKIKPNFEMSMYAPLPLLWLHFDLPWWSPMCPAESASQGLLHTCIHTYILHWIEACPTPLPRLGYRGQAPLPPTPQNSISCEWIRKAGLGRHLLSRASSLHPQHQLIHSAKKIFNKSKRSVIVSDSHLTFAVSSCSFGRHSRSAWRACLTNSSSVPACMKRKKRHQSRGKKYEMRMTVESSCSLSEKSSKCFSRYVLADWGETKNHINLT